MEVRMGSSKHGFERASRKSAGRKHGWLNEPATPRQLEALKNWGLAGDWSHLTKGQANKALEQLALGVDPKWIPNLVYGD
jgi:hypothetical protein